MKLKNILLESRKDDFLNKYKDKFSNQQIKDIFLKSKDLDNSQKFLIFLGDVIDPNNFDETIKTTEELIEKFIRYQQVLDKKDINQYKTLNDIKDAINSHENKVRRQVKKLDGADLVYEDDRFTVVTPLNHKTSCYYGAGTKWCTSAFNGETHFEEYSSDGKLFYVIDKKGKSSDRFYKVAVLNKFEGTQSYWDASDDKFTNGWILGTEEWNKINGAIQEYLQSNFETEIQIFKDKERAKIERERINYERQQRVIQQKLLSAQERRENDEWNLETNDDDLAKMANAVFKVIRDNYEVELNEEVGEDIYYLIPAGYSNFGLTTLEWYGSDNTGTIWSVGDWDEVYEAAKTYVKDSFNELGMERFNRNFIVNMVDDEMLTRVAVDFFNEDVYNNPEAYLDDEDRELSSSQLSLIEKLEEKIETFKEKLDNLEDEYYGGNEQDRELKDTLDEINDEIQETEEEIDEIKNNPEGDYDEDKIEDIIKTRVDEAMYDKMAFIDEFGLDISNYIDENRLAEAVIDTDGVANSLSPYDGSESEVYIDGTYYFVYRQE